MNGRHPARNPTPAPPGFTAWSAYTARARRGGVVTPAPRRRSFTESPPRLPASKIKTDEARVQVRTPLRPYSGYLSRGRSITVKTFLRHHYRTPVGRAEECSLGGHRTRSDWRAHAQQPSRFVGQTAHPPREPQVARDGKNTHDDWPLLTATYDDTGITRSGDSGSGICGDDACTFTSCSSSSERLSASAVICA